MIFDSNHSKLHVFMGFCRFSWGFHGVFSHFVYRLSHIGSPLHQSAHAVHVVVGRRHVQRRAALGVRRVHLDAVGVEEFHQVLRQFEGGKVRAFRRKAGIILHHMNFYISIYDYMCDDSLLSWFSMFVIMDFFFWNRMWGRWPYIVYLYIHIYTWCMYSIVW